MVFFIMLNRNEIFKPKVAIVLATYNGDKYIIEQLDSLFKQIDIEFSLYCSDDSSTDNSFQILKMYESKVANIICSKNSGKPGPASNFLSALRLISDENYVIFCDQDDVWLSNKISSLVVFAIDKLNPDIPGLAYCDAFIVNENLKTSKIKMYGDKHVAPKHIDELLYLNGGVQGASMIINKPMILEMLNYNKYIYMHDQLATYLAVLNKNIYYLNQPLMLYRQHSNNVIGRNISFMKKINLLYNSYLIDSRSWQFVNEFCAVYNTKYNCLENKSVRYFLSMNKEHKKMFVMECIFGTAVLHGSRFKLLTKMLVKLLCGRIIPKK